MRFLPPFLLMRKEGRQEQRSNVVWTAFRLHAIEVTRPQQANRTPPHNKDLRSLICSRLIRIFRLLICFSVGGGGQRRRRFTPHSGLRSVSVNESVCSELRTSRLNRYMSLVAHDQGQVWTGATAPGIHPLLRLNTGRQRSDHRPPSGLI